MDNLDEFSSSTELHVDATSGHLSVTPREVTTTSASTQYRFARCGVRGTVTHLEHGIYGDKNSSLIGFKIDFDFDPGSGRFIRAQVGVSFDKHEEEGREISSPPAVMEFRPRKFNGQITPVKKCNKIVGGLPSSIVPITFESAERFTKLYSLNLTAKPYGPDDDINTQKEVVWKVNENSKQATGIPDELNIALIVQHDGTPFRGTVEISVWTKSHIKLFGRPWPRPNPLIFRPDNHSIAIGTPFRVDKFEDLTDENWRKLASFQ